MTALEIKCYVNWRLRLGFKRHFLQNSFHNKKSLKPQNKYLDAKEKSNWTSIQLGQMLNSTNNNSEKNRNDIFG